MTSTTPAPLASLPTAQLAELAALVEVEARWENQRSTPARPPGERPSVQDLKDRQNVYDAFRTRLTGYNRSHKPAHVPELLLNNPVRLGKWCRAMASLYARLEHVAGVRCPIHLLEKAYRWADKVAERKVQGPVRRHGPSGTIAAAVHELETLGRWCDDQAEVAPAALQT